MTIRKKNTMPLLINTMGGKKHTIFKQLLCKSMPHTITYHNQEKASRLAAGFCETWRTTEGTTRALITSNYSPFSLFLLLKKTASVNVIFISP